MNGIAKYIDYHQKRLEKSFFDIFSKHTTYDLKKILQLPKDSNTYRCRVIYNLNYFEVEYIPYTPYFKTKFTYINIDFSYDYKFLNRSSIDNIMRFLDKQTEAIFVKDSLITDTSISNIACLINNEWLTPKNPLLNGTTRARLLDEKKLVVADITLEDFKNSQKIAFFNALTGFYEISNSKI